MHIYIVKKPQKTRRIFGYLLLIGSISQSSLGVKEIKMHRDDSADQNSRHPTDSSIVLPRQKEITSRTEHISQTRCKAKQIEKEKKKVRRGRKKEKKRKRKRHKNTLNPPQIETPKPVSLRKERNNQE